jgi:hypothetical protein
MLKPVLNLNSKIFWKTTNVSTLATCNVLVCVCGRNIHRSWYSLTHSWSWALLEKLPIVQPLKNFPAFYGTRRFITAFTRALHWSLSWARLIQPILSHPIALRFILILSTHLRLGLPSDLFPSGWGNWEDRDVGWWEIETDTPHLNFSYDLCHVYYTYETLLVVQANDC